MSADLISAMFELIDRADWPGLGTLFCDDVVYERPGYSPFAGRDRVLQFYRHERIIARGTHVLERTVFGDGQGACWGRFTGTTKDGTAIEVRFAEVYRLEDARVKHRTTYFYWPAV